MYSGDFMRVIRQFVSVVAVIAMASAAWAQTAVSAAEITALETTAAAIDGQVAVLQRTDATLAATVKQSLTDVREDVTYLRVKLRRDGSVTRAEYNDVRDRLETLRIKAGGVRVAAQPVLPADGSAVVERIVSLPVGTEFEIKLHAPLSSATAHVEQRLEATALDDVMKGNEVVIPAGALVRGFVSSVRAAGKIDRTGSLTLSFDEIIIDQRPSKLRASIVKALDPKMTEDVARIGTGATVGAIIGGIFGGGKGALLGVMVGGGGTIASTEGSNVELSPGNVLRLRIDQRLDVVR